MPSPPAHTVVVGASLAGLRAVEGLRRAGEDGPVTVVGAEPHLPYDRPPLSKKVLTDDRDPAELTSLPLPGDLGVQWILGSAAGGVDLARRSLRVGGEDLHWDRLVISTGAAARTLPGLVGRRGVHVLRTLDDAVALRSELAAATRVAVVGAGFVGLEVASSCRARGLEVTVVEAGDQPLGRVLGPQIGERVAAAHRRAGVVLETGVTVEGPLGGERVGGLRLGDGRSIEADVVVVGIGVEPSTAWLEGSGVDLDDGVVCDGSLRVLAGGRPVPGVVAAGDVVRWGPPGRRGVRLEHWTNAAEQGEAAARTLLEGDGAGEFGPVPYFWSDQLGTKLQMLGTTDPDDEVAMLDDDASTGRWVAAFGRAGRTVAVLGAGRPARVMKLRAAIEAATPFPPG